MNVTNINIDETILEGAVRAITDVLPSGAVLHVRGASARAASDRINRAQQRVKALARPSDGNGVAAQALLDLEVFHPPASVAQDLQRYGTVFVFAPGGVNPSDPALKWRRRLGTFGPRDVPTNSWKLVGPLEEEYRLVPMQSYRRLVSSIPSEKGLIPCPEGDLSPSTSGEEPGQLAPDVIFSRLQRDSTLERFFGKFRRRGSLDSLVEHERTLHELVRDTSWDVIVPLFASPTHGYVFEYREALMTDLVIHFRDRRRYFSPDELDQIEAFGRMVPSRGVLAGIPLAILADFQISRGAEGLTFLDFEPHHLFQALFDHLERASPQDRELIVEFIGGSRSHLSPGMDASLQEVIGLARRSIQSCVRPTFPRGRLIQWLRRRRDEFRRSRIRLRAL